MISSPKAARELIAFYLDAGADALVGEEPVNRMADDIAAQSRHLKLGDTVTLINRPFRISGIVVHGKGARFYIPLKTAQDVIGADKHVSVFFVRSKGYTEATRAESRGNCRAAIELPPVRPLS